MKELRRYFEAADGRGSFADSQRKFFAKQREDAARRDKIEDAAEADLMALAAGAIMASEAQIEAFSIKLDTYETATVEALIANEKAMELVQARLGDLLDRAHVVEDGRRVFKTRDGTQVFDEFGEEVGRDIVTPDDIDDSRPYWEEYAPAYAEKQALEIERTEIIEFQQRLDDARDEIADGEISTEELDALDAELADLMPSAVASHVPGLEPKPASIIAPDQGVTTAQPRDFSALDL